MGLKHRQSLVSGGKPWKPWKTTTPLDMAAPGPPRPLTMIEAQERMRKFGCCGHPDFAPLKISRSYNDNDELFDQHFCAYCRLCGEFCPAARASDAIQLLGRLNAPLETEVEDE